VNAAALAEQRWGAARGLSNFIYMTVARALAPASSSTAEPSTGLCIPSSATSSSRMTTPAIRSPVPARSIVTASRAWPPPKLLRARYGKPAEQLDDQAAWALEARYRAIGIMNAVLTVSPERVVLGGGVVKKPGLLPIVRTQVKELMSGYSDVGSIDHFIVRPALGDPSGVLGAFHLPMAAHPGLAK
jgi:fructokinase